MNSEPTARIRVILPLFLGLLLIVFIALFGMSTVLDALLGYLIVMLIVMPLWVLTIILLFEIDDFINPERHLLLSFALSIVRPIILFGSIFFWMHIVSVILFEEQAGLGPFHNKPFPRISIAYNRFYNLFMSYGFNSSASTILTWITAIFSSLIYIGGGIQFFEQMHRFYNKVKNRNATKKKQ
jgi:hypothetical protein